MPAVLWRDPGDIANRNLRYGPGSAERMPKGRLKFLEEDLGGVNPKFDVQDEEGIRWRVKPGAEAQSETAATRLLWAVGYFADEDYYLPEIRVEGMPKKLSRGQEFVAKDGVIKGVRLERRPKGMKKIGTWSWWKNPFVDTKELNGLRVMMALMNSWDIKPENNAIYAQEGEHRYLVSDVGATFGQSGNTFRRTKNNLEQYRKSKFIRNTTTESVDFHLASKPHPLNAVIFPHWIELRKREKVVKGIPREDARWMGQLLSQLSAEQIRDCFRAAGHSPEDVEGFARAVEERIQSLKQL
ncbi:MAG: hypothetical protein ACRD2Q_12485 [Terriglobales bacterium]